MNVSLGSDHRGVDQRLLAGEAVKSAGFEVDDQGTHSTESCDYPVIAEAVARQVASGASEFGILLCGTGIGMSIAANKVDGVRAALCYDIETAMLSRQHNNANLLCLSSDRHDQQQMKDIITHWLQTDFEGGRHARRVDKISEIEQRS